MKLKYKVIYHIISSCNNTSFFFKFNHDQKNKTSNYIMPTRNTFIWVALLLGEEECLRIGNGSETAWALRTKKIYLFEKLSWNIAHSHILPSTSIQSVVHDWFLENIRCLQI